MDKGIRTEQEEKKMCYLIRQLKEKTTKHPAHNFTSVPPFKDLLEEAEDALQTFTNNENHANWYEGEKPEEGWCPES